MICVICGFEGDGVREAIAQWRERQPAWDVVPRCADRTDCAARLTIAKGTWPLVESMHSEAPRLGSTGPGLAAKLEAYREDRRHDSPGMTDARGPHVDPITGAVTWPAALPLAPIPAVRPDRPPSIPTAAPRVTDDPETWF